MDILNVIDEIDELNLIIFGLPRKIYQRQDYFNSFDNRTFFQRFRCEKLTALQILHQIEGLLEYPYDWNNAVAPINQLLVFLRFCATGSHLMCIADFVGMHTSTASRIVQRVGRAVAGLYGQYIRMPEGDQEISGIQLAFYEVARFPRVVGVIDCTHIKIQSPGGEDAEVFRNRKGYFSINVQAICNAQLKIMNLVARWPGSTHDVTIFNNSLVRGQFERNQFPNSVILGDSGYNVRPYLMTPLLNPNGHAEQLYNESLIRSRNIIERCFGVWKRRFPILAYGSRLKLANTLTVIVATAVIYNICKDNNEDEPPDPDDIERFLNVMEEDAVPNIPPLDNQPVMGVQVRNDLILNYFNNLHE